jgi:hypothetical protein
MTDLDGGWAGQNGFNSYTTPFTAHVALVKQMLGLTRTMTLVQITSDPYGGGGLAPVGFVDVFPLVNQIDGIGNPTPHGIVYGLPYFSLQGGTSAFICETAIISDRDISSVKAVRGQANPGSRGRFALSDGVYLGGILNGTPTTYFQFTTEGDINVVAPASNTITISAGTLIMHGINEATFDAGGTGFKYKPASIDTYTDGITPSHHAPDPPGPLV